MGITKTQSSRWQRIAKVPLLERKREIVAGQAKERQGERVDLKQDIVENLPQSSHKTRDSIAAEIGVSKKLAQDF